MSRRENIAGAASRGRPPRPAVPATAGNELAGDRRPARQSLVSANARLAAGVCLTLVAGVWLVFGQTLRQGFVNVDDGVYVYENRLITAGLTWQGIRWFFTHAYCDYWAPLLAISHMADCQIFGLWPGGHHLSNVLLFAATVIALFLVLRSLTGALWRSAFVAAAWAWHPLRAESVAWITERKDMLSGLFFLLTLAAYLRYVRQPRSTRRDWATVTLYALGLMCKPTLVSLPLVLLLLDYWPLGRFFQNRGWPGWRPLWREKIPLFVLSAAVGVVTLVSGAQTLVSLRQVPLLTRGGNAVLSGVVYLGQTLLPLRLAAFYPYPAQGVGAGEVIFGLALIAVITVTALIYRLTHPWLIVGWFWYLVMLVPNIGLVQAGQQAHADRFTYLAQIGLLLALTWTVWHWCESFAHGRLFLGTAAAIALITLLWCSRVQASYWRDCETLWRHTLACTSANSFAENNLGVALRDAGKRQEAEGHFRAAIAIEPGHVQAQYNLGNLLFATGRTDEAIERYRLALAVEPHHFDALNNLGIALASSGRIDEAAATYRQALADRPKSAVGHVNFGHTLLAAGKMAEAIGQFQQAVQNEPDQEAGYVGLGSALLLVNRPADAATALQTALRLSPNDETARSGLGSACFLQGQLPEAVANWQAALALQPTRLTTLNNLAWVLATGPAGVRDGAQAVQMAERALRQSGAENPVVLQTLAAAYAEAGRLPEARQTAVEALRLATAQSKAALAAKIEGECVSYEAGQAFHELPTADVTTAKLQPPSR